MRKLTLLFVCLLLAIPCQAEIITVDPNGSADFDTIQAAIDAADNGDIIQLQPGTYTGLGNHNIDFLGKVITVRGSNPNNPSDYVIDCQNIARAFYIHHNFEHEHTRVEGLTIINGYAHEGAGIYCERSSPTIINCTFIGCEAEFRGGGISCCESSPLISNCTFERNIAFEGGAVSSHEFGHPIVESCTIMDNKAFSSGGGIYGTMGCDMYINNCTITQNEAERGGAVACVEGVNVTLSNCLITHNTAWEGAGVYAHRLYGRLVVKNCLISFNGGELGGEIFCTEAETAVVSNCTIIGDCGLNVICEALTGEFINNIIWSSGFPGSPCHSFIALSDAIVVRYCNIEGSGGSGPDWPEHGGIDGGDNIDMPPIFAPDGYHLEPGSPGINEGDPSGDYTEQVDIDGDPRVMWGRIDMGADETVFEPGPSLRISSKHFEFAADQDRENPAPQSLFIRNTGTGTVNWQIVENCPWLEIDPASGQATGEADEAILSVDISGMVQGQYQCAFIVEASGAYDSPQMVGVDLTVHGPSIDLSATQLEFFLTNGNVDPESQTLTIANGAGGTLNWNITYDCNWISVEPVSGISVKQSDEIIVWPTDLNDFTIPGHHICELIVSADGASNSPQTVEVILHVEGDLRVPQDYNTIQAAIDAAMDGDVVVVSEGIYRGDGNRDLDLRGKAIIVQSTNPDNPCVVENTVIDCQGTIEEPHRGFRINSGEGRDSVVSGFTITNGYAPDENHGGGLLPVGGAIWCRSADPTIAKCRILNNAGHIGGGIYGWASDFIILQCEISHNSAGFCGGIHVRVGRPEIINCVIENNSGGGIYLMGCWDPLVSGCRILRNVQAQKGGGIYTSANHDSIKIKNCVIAGNSAGGGGGILVDRDYVSATITNCTIADNKASHYAGGVYNYGIWGRTPMLNNCIVWGNQAPHGSQFSGTMSVKYCDVQGGYSGSGNINDNPLFCNPNNFDYHLVRWSPCVDKGDPTGDYSGQTDIDGEPRMMGGRVDMGADEVIPNNAPVACIEGGDRMIEAEGSFGAKVTLDGSCSSDLDSEPGTNDDIEHFEWYRVDPCDSNDEEFLGSGEIIDCNLPPGEHTIILEVIDKAGAFDTDEVTIIVAIPKVEVVVPQPNTSLQDGVTLMAESFYMSNVDAVYFYVREPGDVNGIPIGYEDLPGTLNSTSGRWGYDFETTELDDGYYVVLAKAVDTYGDEVWSEVVPFSIRNWAVLELLPSSRHYRAGRTVPVKFALRIDEAVDPDMPFVYSEELEVRIFDAANPGNILQTSLYGDASKDYRIDGVGELYITNFKTAKIPAVYEVEIWRISNNFLIGDFTFSTEILGKGDITGDGKTDFDDLVVITENWLGNDTIADIAPDPEGDGVVDFHDFAVFAENWFEVTSQ